MEKCHFTDLRYQKIVRNPDELLRQLQEFRMDLKMTIGVWSFCPGGGRFHEAYCEPIAINDRIKMLYDMADYLRGVEAHFEWEVNEDNIHLYHELEKATGIKLIMVGIPGFFDRAFEFGSLSNPVSVQRDKARDMLVRGMKFAREAGIPAVGLWPGIDGYTYPLGTPFYLMWELFESALAEAMDEVPGVRINIEPKPYEPIPNNIYRTTADGLLLAKDVEARLQHPTNRRLLDEGHSLVALQPEIGHIAMGYEDVPYAYMRTAREGRLSHIHWNSQPLGNYDQDLNVGVVGWDQAEALMYALKMMGYTGYHGVDICPERMPVQKAVQINHTVLTIMQERIDALPHERILDCYLNPYQNRGELELIIANARRVGAVESALAPR